MAEAKPIRLTRTLILCALTLFIDGYDLNAMPLAIPHVVRLWGVEASSFGVALSAVLVGLGAGAILIGPFGDSYGRRPLVITAVFCLGLATLLTATSSSVGAFVAWRLLTGLALGAFLPNVTALVSEIAPPARRAGLLSLVSAGISLGGMSAGLFAPPLVALGGWQGLFIAPGVLMMLLAAVLWWGLPESPNFLAGRSQPRVEKPSFLLPLTRRFWIASAVFIGLYTVNALALYMLIGWLPTILPQAGFSLAEAARFSSLVQGGGLATGLILSAFLDRGKAAWAVGGTYAAVALALIGFSFVPPTIYGWGALLLVAGGGISGAHMAIMALGTGFYPPATLSSAIGLATAVARVGAIGGPMVGAQLIAAGLSPQAFFLAIVPAVAICIIASAAIPLAQRSTAAA